MVDIRPNALPDAILPLRGTDELVVDQGTDGVRKVDPFALTDSTAPIATQSEAQVGTNNVKRMTPLRTKQSIASEVGVSIASNTQGAKADSAVQSVNGKSGNAVTLAKGDVGLGNVDNTSDADKPISTATQTALNAKANSSVTISAGAGLTGGGNLTANRTVSLNATSIASLAKADSAVQTVNGVSPVAGNVTVSAEEKRLQDTRTTAIAESFGSNVQFVETAGYSSVGDGGGALYKRVSSEPTHAGKFQSADGAWWEIVLDGGIARVGQFGSGQAAVEAAHTVADVIIIDKEITVSTTATWPNGKSYMFTTGGKLSVSNGVTLTVGGVVHADTWQGLPSSNPRKIFDCAGTGKVVGIRSVKPEWWGAKGDGVSDDQPALQTAHDCVEQSQGSSGGRPEIVLRQATYGLGRTLSLRPTAHINLKMVGAGPIFGTRFTELSSFSTSNGSECIRIDGNSDNIEKIAGYDIGNFSVSGDVADGSSLVGVWVGGDGSSTDLIGVQQSSIHDVYVENFSFCWRIANCRLIDFDRCSGWSITIAGAVGALITVDAAGAFTGDMNFNDCQFVVDPSNSGKCVSISNSTAGSEIKGIRFNNTIFYKGSRFCEIYCTAGNIGDIWINPGCQFDGFGGNAVHIEGDGASAVIDNIHVLSTYIRGINANSVGVQVSALNGAAVRDIHVTGNQIFSLLSGARAIAIGGGVKGGVVANNIITDIDNPANEAILIDGSRFSIVGNVLNRSGAQYTAWLVTLGTNSSYCIADNNVGSGIVATATVRNLGTNNVVGTSNN